ncbi:MAG: SpoIIE family protein phosphatase [Oscillospiraceae bacterium]|nr:SpoIIE family protein phosphatase [Oscillospiraceae bacterium]
MMKNRTDFIGGAVVDRLVQSVKTYKQIAWAAGVFFAGFLLSASYILNGLSPFGAAFTAVIWGDAWLFAALGSLIGYLFSLHQNFSMKYIGAVMIIICFKWMLNEHTSPQRRAWLSPLLAWLPLTATSLLVSYAYGFNGYSVTLSVAESLLACGAAYFFSRTMTALESGKTLSQMHRTELSSLIISLCIFTAAFTSLQIGIFSVGRVIAVVIVTVCAWAGQEALGAMAGVACGTAVTLALADSGFLLGGYSLGGLFAGMFAPLGRMFCCAAFLLTNAAVCLTMGQPKLLLAMVIESLAATAVFMLLPKNIISSLQTQTVHAHRHDADREVKTLLLSRLEDASFALSDIAKTTQAVSQSIDRIKSGTITDISSQTADKICRGCEKNTQCWQKGYNETMDCLNNMTRILRQTGSVSPQDFTQPLAERCIQKELLAGQIAISYQAMAAKQTACRKLSQIRSVVTDQFDGMAQLLNGIIGQMEAINVFDDKASKKVHSHLQRLKLNPLETAVYTDSANRLYIRVKLYSSKLAGMDKPELTKELSDMLQRELAPPVIQRRGETACILFSEKAALSIKAAYAQHNRGENKLCGDSYSIFYDKSGNVHMVLSDGMGSGSAAAVDSTMTVSLIRKLLCAGAKHDAALKLVNSALLVKSGEESLSTVDVASVDLFSGKTQFYKAGAAPTFIKKSNKTGYIESTSLPVGILTAAAFEKSALSLRDGDMVVMISDGAAASGCDWIKNTIDKFNGEDIQALCDEIVNTAQLKRADAHDDDITVMAVKLQKAS